MADPNAIISVNLQDNASKGLKDIASNTRTLDQQLSTLTGTSAKLDAGLKAFSWTTFAGGALNVSTAIAQLVTSSSNLARVQLLVRNSMVGIERAEDLLARKTMMLNREIEKNSSVSQRALQLRNEIATATDDLANKEEKLKLAQDQVTDTYILFTSNVVNTLFGTLQTLAGLKSMLALKFLATSAAIDKETASIATNSLVGAANIKVQTGMIASRAALGGSIATTTASTSVLTKVMGGLGGVMGVTVVGAVAAAALGIGALVYEQVKANDKTIQFKDTLDELSKKFGEVELSANKFEESMNFSNPFTGSISQRIQELEDAKTLLDKHLKENEASFSKPNLFMSEQDRIKMAGEAMKLKKTLNDDLKNSNEEEVKVLANLDKAYKSLSSGKLTNVTVEIGKNFNTIKSDIISSAKMLDSLTPQTNDWSVALEKSMNHWIQIHNLGEEEKKVLTELINLEIRSNDVKSSGLKNENQLLKENAELKKKLDTEWGYTKPGRNFRSFLRGDTGYFTGEEGGPFSGTINQKINKHFNDQVARNAFQRIKDLENAGKRMLDEGSSVQQVINAIEPAIAKIKNETNISYGGIGGEFLANMKDIKNKFFRHDQSWQRTLGQLQLASLRKDFYNTAEQNRLLTGTRYKQSVKNLESMTSKSNAFNIQTAQNYYKNQVYGGSVNAGLDFYAGVAKRNQFNNSVQGQEILYAASLITGERSMFTGGREKRARKLSKAETDTLSLAGALGFRPSNIDKVDGIIYTTVDSMISESNAFLNSMTGSIPRSMISGVFGAAGSLITNIQESFGSKLYSAGYLEEHALQKDINKLKNKSASSLFNNVVSRFNGGNYGEYDATVMSTLLGATFAHPELSQEYSSFQNKIAPILGITHNEFTSVLSESTRGYSEIDDRMRYKGRLEQISTGATVF